MKTAIRSSVIVCAPVEFGAATAYLRDAVHDQRSGRGAASVGANVTGLPIAFAVACAVVDALLTGAHRLELDATSPVAGAAASVAAGRRPATGDAGAQPKAPAVSGAVADEGTERGGLVWAAKRQVMRWWRGRLRSHKPV
jgi:hypothetical protein